MYYPLSQITPNLYTNGGEYINASTQEQYAGYYFKTSKGQYFTGRNTNDKPNILLIPYVSDGVINIETPNDISNSIYNIDDVDVINFLILNKKTSKDIQSAAPGIPLFNPTTPSSQDYQNNEFRRYFAKKTNELTYVEISKSTYEKLINKDPQIDFSLYFGFNIPWSLSGDKQKVAQTNKNIVEIAIKRQKLYKFDEYLKQDYLKYYQ
jgi:hypothetical protein